MAVSAQRRRRKGKGFSEGWKKKSYKGKVEKEREWEKRSRKELSGV